MRITTLLALLVLVSCCGSETDPASPPEQPAPNRLTSGQPSPEPDPAQEAPGEEQAKDIWKDLKMTDEGKVELTDEEWRKRLTPEQFRVLRGAGTEMCGTGEYEKTKAAGTYLCAACGHALFTSSTKYDSGSGWPAFWAPAEGANIATDTDYKIGYARTEVKCGRCDSHLGHVFDDGPPPTGRRYCINSVCLVLKKNESAKEDEKK